VKEKMITAHMRTAYNYAELSSARRLKVGAIVVRDDSVISIGYNGMPAGWENDCEFKEYFYYGHNFGESAADYFDQNDDDGRMYRLKTRPEVLHAEMNALGKLAGSDRSAREADMFVTHAPCMDCAKLIHAARIRRVFYSETYRSDSGVKFLEKCGIEVQQVE
jgi:dCMP deaminase